MGTFLGVLFIVGAAATGVLVGTRPTVMDGGWIAAKLTKTFEDEHLTLACDREIPVGVAGARFRCVQSRLGASQEVWYRMARDGNLERTDLGRIDRGPRAGEAPGAPDPAGAGED